MCVNIYNPVDKPPCSHKFKVLREIQPSFLVGKLTFTGRRQCRDAQVLPWGCLAAESCFVAEELKGSSRILYWSCPLFYCGTNDSRRGPELFATLYWVWPNQKAGPLNAKLVSYQTVAFVSFWMLSVMYSEAPRQGSRIKSIINTTFNTMHWDTLFEVSCWTFYCLLFLRKWK